MRFPLPIRNMFYAPNCRCAWCRKNKVCEPNSMALLSAGALLMDRRTASGRPDERMDGFMHIDWHGAHTSDGGIGEHPDIYKTVSIAKDIKGGQFDVYFCSTKCLRAFLNHAVDTLEAKINTKSKYPKHK